MYVVIIIVLLALRYYRFVIRVYGGFLLGVWYWGGNRFIVGGFFLIRVFMNFRVSRVRSVFKVY